MRPRITKNTDTLFYIALKELMIAQQLNESAESVQCALGTELQAFCSVPLTMSVEYLLEVNDRVQETLVCAIEQEIVLMNTMKGTLDCEYAYIYNESAQTVPVESDVTFDTNGITTAGITHTPGTAEISIAKEGNYSVAFSVSGVEPNQFALFLNDIVVPGTVYGSGAGTQQNNGHAIIAIAAGDILTLRNHSSTAAVTLQTLAGGTQTNVNASILLEKLT